MDYGPPSWLRKIMPLTILVTLALMGGYTLYAIGRNEGYAPKQPFDFNHRVHAGDHQIPCQYCHVNAEQGRVATVPSLNVCMNCHNEKAGVGAGKPRVEELKALYKEGKEVEWTRVHDLPDFVYFSHRTHLRKKVACQDCHGPVQEMERVEQVAPLTMGWCLDCHREKKAATECTTCHQ